VLALPAVAAAHFADFKSPGAGMHFSTGQPIVVFADLFDDYNNHGVIVCPDGQTVLDNNGVPGPAVCSGGGTPTGWPQLQVLVDDVPQTDTVTQSTTVTGTTNLDGNGNPDPIDFNRFTIAGVPVGVHQMRVRGLIAPPPASDGAIVDGPPMTIYVDELPSGDTTLTLTDDVTGNVEWDHLVVVGNGHVVRPNGTVTITNSLVLGLGSPTSNGIEGTASALDIENSVFESTGAIDLALTGAAVVIDNEFRSNNLLTFEASNPDAVPILTLSGESSAEKLFQGNRIAAGRLVFETTNHWLIGGDTDDETNILMGPRATINLVDGTSNVIVRGNYDHHNYRGGWSQGFNLYFSRASSDGILVEHNLFRGGSWPIQNVTGEFRYNLIYGYGHNWLRSGEDGAQIHHNVFAPEQGGCDLNQGIWFYSGEVGIEVYNNTFDGGGHAFAGPVVGVDNDSHVVSLRNNLMTYTSNYENSDGTAHVIADAGTFGTVDYNAFYSPDNTTRDNYDIDGMIEGVTPGFAEHDVSSEGIGVTDGQLAESPFAQARVDPYESLVDEAAVWNRTQRLSGILAAFRAHYVPAVGSPVIDTGDPADNDGEGLRADIGAIDFEGHDLDRFGRWGLVDEIFRDGFE